MNTFSEMTEAASNLTLDEQEHLLIYSKKE